MANMGQPQTNPNRHAPQCKVCQHPDKQRIEAAFKQYKRVEDIAEEYDVPSQSIYLHARVFLELTEARDRNIGGIAAWLLEKGQKANIEVTPALMAAAMTTSAKIHGLFIDRTMDVTKSLETASYAALEFYRSHGRLPTPEEEATLAPAPSEPQ